MTSTRRRPSSSTAGRSDRDAGEPACDPHRSMRTIIGRWRDAERATCHDPEGKTHARYRTRAAPRLVRAGVQRRRRRSADGTLRTGRGPHSAARRARGRDPRDPRLLRWFLDRRGRITLNPKLVVRVGDLAFLANRWSLAGGTMPDGSPAELGATTAEVARLQPDGTWLYVIDNAWGDQAAS